MRPQKLKRFLVIVKESRAPYGTTMQKNMQQEDGRLQDFLREIGLESTALKKEEKSIPGSIKAEKREGVRRNGNDKGNPD